MVKELMVAVLTLISCGVPKTQETAQVSSSRQCGGPIERNPVRGLRTYEPSSINRIRDLTAIFIEEKVPDNYFPGNYTSYSVCRPIVDIDFKRENGEIRISRFRAKIKAQMVIHPLISELRRQEAVAREQKLIRACQDAALYLEREYNESFAGKSIEHDVFDQLMQEIRSLLKSHNIPITPSAHGMPRSVETYAKAEAYVLGTRECAE